jgi:hypothetical protein
MGRDVVRPVIIQQTKDGPTAVAPGKPAECH